MLTPEKKLGYHRIAIVSSLLFALIGFTYNAWRLEVTEDNANIRTAAFEMLKELSELEVIIFTGYYDGDREEGSPRRGWAKVVLLENLSVMATPGVRKTSEHLRSVWDKNWSSLELSPPQGNREVEQISKAIDEVRAQIILALNSLE